MGLSKILKTNAKHALSGAWGRAIGVIFLAGLPLILINLLEYAIRQVTGIPEFVDLMGTMSLSFDDVANTTLLSTLISGLMLLLTFILTAPLSQGLIRWYYRRTGGENEGVTELFYYFEAAGNYFKSLWLYLQIGVRMGLWTLLLSLPLVGGIWTMIMLGFSNPDNSAQIFSILYLLGILWGILMSIFLAIIGLRYFLAPYILVEQPQIKLRTAIKQSIKLVRGYKSGLFVFMLSFIPWYLPLVLILLLMIPMAFMGAFYIMEVVAFGVVLLLIQLGLMFYAGPYIRASYAMYARYLIELGQRNSGDSVNATREYIYKTDIDRYMEEQSVSDKTQEGDAPN